MTSPPVRPTRGRLLAGVSLAALSAGHAFAAPVPLSPAWFAARASADGAAAAGSASAASTLTRVTAAQQNISTLANRLAAMRTAQQSAASAAAATAGSVPNGLAAGGLVIAPGAIAGGASWQGATLPTQSNVDGLAKVNVTQTAAQAMLTWQSFNIGRKTVLNFDQSAGGSNASSWVVLNRVQDPSAAPSLVLGSITAPGKVYVMNANGIVFGAGAQVNVGGLLAATATITDTQFAAGLYGAASGGSFLPSFTGAPLGSEVLVQQGASIATAAPPSVTSGGGDVLLLGDVVQNDGQISTPQGQTILAAGQDFILRQGYSASGNQTATVLGSQVEAQGGTGAVTNNGLIQAAFGDITLAGHAVTQAGIAMVTTSVNTRGTVHLLNDLGDRTGTITLADGSVTVADPDDTATTAINSVRDGLIAQSASNNALRPTPISSANPQLGDVSTLSDRLDLSRIEITTGGTADFAAGSLTMSHGGQIAVQASRQIAAEDGAALDVSGSTGAVLPMSSNILSVSIQGNELRDAPVNRDTGLLSSSTVSIDTRDLVQIAASGADASIRDYTQGGLLEVSGYLANQGHTIDEWAAIGGTIHLSATNVITAPHASIDIAGGSVNVAAGALAQSWLVGADGRLYNVNTAPANIAYLGVYGGLTVDYTRFGGSDTYTSAVASPAQIFASGYSYARDAGSLVVSAQTAVLEAPIAASVSNGSRQGTARPAGITDPYQYGQDVIALPGTLALGGFDSAGTLYSPIITIAGTVGPLADDYLATGILPAKARGSYQLSAGLLNADALGGLSAITGGAIDVQAPLVLAPGGTLTLAASAVTVGATLTARGGSITLADVVTNPVNSTATPLLSGTVSGKGDGISVASGATLDLRGLFTNVPLGGALADAALINGGSLTIDSLRSLQLLSGSAIDASSGGAVLAGGKLTGGRGGNVSITGNDPLYGISRATTVLAATLRDAGVQGGGTLALTLNQIAIGDATDGLPRNEVLLAATTFQSGFSDYVVNGFEGLQLTQGTALTVAEPVYVPYGGSFGAPTGAPSGSDPQSVYGLILPPVYTANRANARLTQRQGAGIELISNNRPGQADQGGGDITLAPGSAITVDPGQSVRIEAEGQITDDATIIAHGGSIALINEQRSTLAAHNPVGAVQSLSIWVGGDARIDASGIATIASDFSGRPFGTVLSGGTVTLGGDGGTDATASQIATAAYVLLRPGADIDANGAAATIDLLAGSIPTLAAQQNGAAATDRVLVAGSGGVIALSSTSGIAIDGAITAAAGGTGAAGGTLAVTIEAPVFGLNAALPDALRRAHILTLSSDTLPDQSLAASGPGDVLPLTAYGAAALSQQQIDTGGFGTLSLYARDAFVFQGDVALHASAGIMLSQGVIGDSLRQAQVSIAAPYVKLSGETPLAGDGVSATANNAGWRSFDGITRSTLSISADLIDVVNAERLGITGGIPLASGGTRAVDVAGFATTSVSSTGDIRFFTGSLTTPGNVDFTAAQLYPVSGAVAKVFAGYDQYSSARNLFLADGAITVHGLGGALPAVPYSVGGSLSLIAGAVVQDGVIRAPEGTIALGGVGIGPGGLPATRPPTDSFTLSVTLAPGSVTSVSLDGVSVPYGGTVDGVTYTLDGAPVGSFSPVISLAGASQNLQQGSLLDLSGGGALAGAGFISGRGGSVDVLQGPLPSFDAASGTVSAPGFATAPVYAILPGYSSAYAPTGTATYAAPALGAQITIGAGVPGIAPGTYTLLPANYALLPGGVRVQIDLGQRDTVPGVQSLGAGSYLTNATSSIANADVSTALPVQVTLTTQAGVLVRSQYDTESYSQFELASAARYGTPRGALPEDGKTLSLVFPAASLAATPLLVDGATDFAAVSGYHGGQATIGGVAGSTLELEVTADGASPTRGFTAIDASALNALDASRLVIGGALSPDASITGQLDFTGTADEVAVRDGATLRAPEIFLTAGASGRDPNGGAISVDAGATLDTIGAGAAPYDSSGGYYYNAFGYTLVALSNGRLVFTPSTNTQRSFGAINIADGASLITDGTLNFATDKGLALGAQATYGARYLSIDVDTVNLASDAALAQQAAGTLILPSGLLLTQDVLTRLLDGDPATGAPALQSLVLSADKSVNFAGSVSLDTLNPATGQSSLQQLVLNTPAIYGYGNTTDVASISTDTLYWNGVAVTTGTGSNAVTSSALPGGVVANGPGTGTGTLVIDARNIVLGYGPQTAPNDQISLDRLVEGFANVTFNASSSITGADRGTLSVYQSAATTYGQAGSGGNLSFSTPLLTGNAGSLTSITAGGQFALLSTAAQSTTAAPATALGAEIDVTAASIQDQGAIALHDGRLTMTSTSGDITLAAGSVIDLSGETIQLLDQTRYAGGGSLALSANAGNIASDPASRIDISATNAAAGSIAVTAMQGTTNLEGAIEGGAGPGQDGGQFTLRTLQLPDFTALNAVLDAGNLHGLRSFELGAGNIDITGTIAAHTVVVTADAGALDVTGTIDASGPTFGSISLAATSDLTIADGASLLAQGTILQTDSTGAAIEADNRATVQLSTSAGTLTLGQATIDVAAPGGLALGQVLLTAPRLLDGGNETGDIAVNAAAPVQILGAETVALYGARTYTPTDSEGTIAQTVNVAPAGAITLDAVNADNALFLSLAQSNSGLQGRIAGLAAYGAAFHLRPADVIQSSTASNGNLTVQGDLDLSTLRYGALAGTAAGAGEVGLLTLRAANNLFVNGSITDGFATPADALTQTRDDKGWLLYANEPLGQAVTLPQTTPQPIELANGSSFATTSGTSLGFGITIAPATLAANVVIPTPVVTARAATIPAAGLVATARITGPDGTVIAMPGQVLAAGTIIPAGSTLATGSVVPFTVRVANHTFWPAGADLSLFTDLSVRLSMARGADLTLPGGVTIPSGASLVFSSGASSLRLRAIGSDGAQGLIYATANLLPAGSQSWSVNLVGGANLASADLLAVQPLPVLSSMFVSSASDPSGSIVLADTHYTLSNRSQPTASFSVIRTGTGSLNLVAGGDVSQRSLFGVYTAGTDTSLGADDAAYQATRAPAADGTLLGRSYQDSYGAVIADQQRWYPDHGGDLTVFAQGDVVGDILGGSAGAVASGSDDIGNWLWRQGGSRIGQSTSWSINFGSYVLPLDLGGNVSFDQPVLTGFTGFGALGGGNVSITAGRNAGEVDTLDSSISPVSQGLVVAVASTGRVAANGSTTLTGGGTLRLDVSGTLNPALQSASNATTLGGTLTGMRGQTDVQAGQVGRIDLTYNAINASDPRPQDPFTTQYAVSSNGIIVAPGDGIVSIDSMRDLVLAGAGDPGRQDQQALTAISSDLLPAKSRAAYGGNTGFTLWTSDTAIELFSAGGNLTPSTAAADGIAPVIANDQPTDNRFVYPAVLDAAAASGSLYYGQQSNATTGSPGYSLELAPSATGNLTLLAARSVYGHGYAIDVSGADPSAIPVPENPAYTDQTNNPFARGAITNFLDTAGNVPNPTALFAFQADTPTTDLHAPDTQPARIYAVQGDLVNVQYGEVLNFVLNSNEPVRRWYLSGKPAWLIAGQDIVSGGTRPSVYFNGYATDTFVTYPNERQAPGAALSSGSLFLNLDPTDISLLSAGRDILGSYAYVAGPGLLEVTAARNITQTGDSGLDFGVFRSIGPVIDVSAASRTGGADLSVLAGTGAAGSATSAFAALYYDPANQANLALPLTDPSNAGKVQQTYQVQLQHWLQQNYGYQGSSEDALTFFDTLPALDQAVFDRSVFFQELLASGRQESDPDSAFYKSYARGRTAISTLFPAAASYDGNVTMDSGTVARLTNPTGTVPVFDAGLSTLSGGSIQVLTPGGGQIYGITGGSAPGASSGVITSGSGDIAIYALDSVLLGQSRVFTTFGGNIQIWSAQGDINAGRGAKTTTIYQPPLLSYDDFGGLTLSPAAPTSGAGIATLAPIAGTVAGNVDLVAPLGTVDAGEAGIRVSGNLNIAAQTVLNAANVDVKGSTSGNTATVATNTAAATQAASAAGSAVNAATSSTGQTRAAALTQQPSVITVEIITDAPEGDQRRRKAA